MEEIILLSVPSAGEEFLKRGYFGGPGLLLFLEVLALHITGNFGPFPWKINLA